MRENLPAKSGKKTDVVEVTGRHLGLPKTMLSNSIWRNNR
jgi:hypothetical protein